MDPRQALGVTVAVLAVVAACCPPPDPVEPTQGIPPPALITGARTMPTSVLSRYNVTPARRGEAVKEVIQEPEPIPVPPKAEPDRPRELIEPPVAKPQTAKLPDEVVLQLIESGRLAFVRCFKKAYTADPIVVSFKVRVHVQLDGNGVITSSRADTPVAPLAECLTRATGYLVFPASGKPVAVDLPLIWRAY